MRKKTVLVGSLLIATLLQAEIDENGFFVGLDVSKTSSKVKYDNSGNMALLPYTNDLTDARFSLKVGYQAYFTRVYARYTSYDYKDEARDKFTISSGKTYDFNAEYIPVFYVNESKDWNIRGIFGLGLGYNSSSLSDYDEYLLPVGESAGSTQNYMEYGYQVGVMSETSLGVSFEAGYRARFGNLQEFTDTANNSTFSLESGELYLGINYLF